MKRLLSFLLIISLVFTGVLITNFTDVSAGESVSATIASSKCKLSSKKLSGYDNIGRVFDSIYIFKTKGYNDDVISVSNVTKNSLISIKAKDPIILYLTISSKNEVELSGYTDKKCTKPAKSYTDNLAFSSYEGNNTNTFSDLVLKCTKNNSVSNTHQYIMSKGETVYLKPSANMDISIEYFYLGDYSSEYGYNTAGAIIDNVNLATSEVTFKVSSSSSKYVGIYYKINSNDIDTGYADLRDNMYNISKSTYSNISSSASSTTKPGKFDIDVSYISRKLNSNLSSKNKCNFTGILLFDVSDDTAIVPFKFADIRSYDSSWSNSNSVPEPISLSSGSKVIVGIVDKDAPSNTIKVKVNNKEYSATLKEKYGVYYYTIKLKSALKVKDIVTFWYSNKEDAKTTYKVTKD